MAATVIGIDVGTSLVKACLLDAGARCLVEVERPLAIDMPRPGTAEQDGNAIMAAIVAMLGELSRREPDAASRVVAIGASGQTAGAMGVDRDGRPVTPWYPSALDTRIGPQLARMKAVAGEALFARNGAWPFTVPRMLWWRDTDPALFGRIARVPSLAGFVIGSLSADPLAGMAIDATTMTWYGAADLAARRWDDGLVRAFDLPPDLLPPAVPSFSLVGRLAPAAAAATGLEAGIPLAVGIGDTVASLIGANVLRPGEVYSVNGSFTNYLVCLDRCLIDAGTQVFQPLASPLDDVWYAILYVAAGGFVHRRMASLLTGAEDGPAFASLDRLAEAVAPGADGLVFLPYALGRFCPPDPTASAGLHGLTLAHGRGEVWRAVMEGLTYDLADLVEAVGRGQPGWTPEVIRLTGGGSRSAFWCQLQADMLGVPAERFATAPSAPVGAALTAGTAVGLWPDLRTAAALLDLPSDRTEPDRSRRAPYAALAARRRGVIESLRPSWSALAAGRIP